MTIAIRPTRRALRVHQSHLATTHRAPLVQRSAQAGAAGSIVAARTRATAFTPMTRDPLAAETALTQTQSL